MIRSFAAAVGLLLLAAPPASACHQSSIIFFDVGSTEPREDGIAQLEAFASQLLGVQDLEAVIIVGHSDRTGSTRARAKIAVERAEAVRNQLMAYGLPQQLLRASGAADEQPLRPTDDHVREPLNRRVELSVRYSAADNASAPGGVPVC